MQNKREQEIREIVREETGNDRKSGRPTGLTVICILGFLVSILMLFIGIAGIGVSSVIESLPPELGAAVGSGPLFAVLGLITSSLITHD
ncbi:MAG: hypothetical protein HY517_03930 [Candidatus Aenigmarchaeota archaeon]|nr:hypothetical protein [Candidatus Aenigmarchaeota archaeon]